MSDPSRYYSSTAVRTTLSTSINSSADSLQVASSSGFPVLFPFTLVLEKDSANEEIVSVTGSVGAAFTIVRAFDGTSARSHSAGTSVEHAVSAKDFTDFRTHEAAAANVHDIGAGASVVGTTTAQTLTNKTLGGNLAAGGFRVTGLADPSSAQDAATKNFVETGVTSQLVQATTQATNAGTSATASAASATASQASRVASESARDSALASQTSATASQSAAATSATNAASSATSASGSATTATTQASTATTQAGTATTQATNASTSASTASTQAGVATTQAGIATTQATNSSSSASAASASAVASAASEAAASGSATTATTGASTATAQASTATTQAGIATTQAGIATTQAGIATTQAGISTAQAVIATTQATNAATSASDASGSASSAASSAASAATALDNFDDRYLGSKSSAPTLDNDGNALIAGALYFNSTSGSMFVYDGATWLAVNAGTFISQTIFDAKGDLVVGSAADTAARLGVGADGFVLTADSAEATGLKWSAAAGGGAGLQDVFFLMGA